MAAQNPFEEYIAAQQKTPSQKSGVFEEKVDYAFTASKEIEDNIKLLPQEIIEKKYRSALNGNISYAVITSQRIIFLKHRLFWADSLLYVPFSSITRLRIAGRYVIYITCNNVTESFWVTQGFSRNLKNEPTQTRELFDLLKDKLPLSAECVEEKLSEGTRLKNVFLVVILVAALAIKIYSQYGFSGEIASARKSWSKGNYPQALQQAQLALSKATTDGDKSLAHHWIGISYYRLADYKNASEEENQAIALNPSFNIPYVTLSAISLHFQDYEKAHGYAQKAVDLAPKYGWAHNDLGLSLIGLGKRDEGIEELRKAVAISPKSKIFQDNLTKALQQK